MEMYPHTPSVGVTDTSRQAAEHIDAKTWLNRVLVAVRERPSTMDEIALAYGVLATTTRPRGSQLSALGLIYDSGQRRKNQYGRNCIVWTAVPEQTKLF